MSEAVRSCEVEAEEDAEEEDEEGTSTTDGTRIGTTLAVRRRRQRVARCVVHRICRFVADRRHRMAAATNSTILAEVGVLCVDFYVFSDELSFVNFRMFLFVLV